MEVTNTGFHTPPSGAAAKVPSTTSARPTAASIREYSNATTRMLNNSNAIMDTACQNHGCATKSTIAKTVVTKLVVISVTGLTSSDVGTEDAFRSRTFATPTMTAATAAMKRSAAR